MPTFHSLQSIIDYMSDSINENTKNTRTNFRNVEIRIGHLERLFDIANGTLYTQNKIIANQKAKIESLELRIILLEAHINSGETTDENKELSSKEGKATTKNKEKK